MGKIGYILLLVMGLTGCKPPQSPKPSVGVWRAELKVMDNQILPFNFRLMMGEGDACTLEIYNAEEVIHVDEVRIHKDSIIIKMPVFEGYMAGKFTKDSMEGEFIKESLGRVVPFRAIWGETQRFDAKGPSGIHVSGIWETEFSAGTGDQYMGKGVFVQSGDRVTGTFQTTTGDKRYLDGVMDGDSLKLSAFDGAHAFLFVAKATDSSLNGTFYSGNHFKEPFAGKRNESFELPSPDSLTFLKQGYDTLSFSFPDKDGNRVALSDPRFNDKVVLVQIMGTWCPNCLDETKFYVDYLKEHQARDLEVVALAFEYAKTREGAFKSIKRLQERIGVGYPILLAQFGTSNKGKAQEKLPMLNQVLSYPTTIFIDKKGRVRKIHTGFNGPATGEKFVRFKTDFHAFVTQLLSE